MLGIYESENAPVALCKKANRIRMRMAENIFTSYMIFSFGSKKVHSSTQSRFVFLIHWNLRGGEDYKAKALTINKAIFSKKVSRWKQHSISLIPSKEP